MALWVVTGGCGFIGSHLVAALRAAGERVRVLDNLSSGKRGNIAADVELYEGDIADEEVVAKALAGASGCFHLAAVASVQRCSEEWVASHRSNLTGTIAIFDRARRVRPSAPIPVVYASSAAVYGDNPTVPLKEAAATVPLSAYGADKLACELHARVAWSAHGVPNVGLRFFNVYGPRQDPFSPYSGVIAIFTDRMRNGREIEIFGDGHQSRDFIYVTDVVAHLIAAMRHLKSGARVFNVCTGQPISVLELAAMLATITRSRPKITHRPPRPGDIRSSIGDPAAAMMAFGMPERTQLIDGLNMTLAADD